MNKLSDLDPDVLALYQGLISGKYKDCEDFLTSPTEEYNTVYLPRILNKKELDIFFDGLRINDFFNSEDIDYGL